MAFREVAVTEIREALRAWLGGAGLRKVAERAGVDRKTARRYVEAAVSAGLDRDGGDAQLTDELLDVVAGVVRPVRPGGHGSARDALEACHAQIKAWVDDGLSVVKIGVLLERQGMKVPYRTPHRFCAERCGVRPQGADGPGRGRGTGRGMPARLRLHGHALGPCYRAAPEGARADLHRGVLAHMFVHLSFSQTLAAFIAGCEAAWAFFGGVFKVIIPDNASPIVADADAVNPRFTAGWLDYAQHCGFATDAARVRSPRDKATTESAPEPLS